MKAQKNSDLVEMPFDQYGRYLIVSNIIKELAVLKKQQKYNILDVGGYNGSLYRFFEADQTEITVLDVYDSNQSGYVKGTALQMPFDDKSFDYVVSFEVFEHIPRDDRQKFVEESLRVSNGTLLLTAPFTGPNNEVSTSEEYVNSLWKKIHKKDHEWLYEHILYKTPKVEELEKILDKQKVAYKKIGNNELILWNLMQSATFITTIYRDSGRNESVQRFYNENLGTLELLSSLSYRYIFLMGADAKLNLKSMSPQSKEKDPKKVYELINKIFLSISNDIELLVKENQTIRKEAADLEAQKQKLQQEITDIKNSSSWKVANKIAAAGRKVPGGKRVGKWVK